MVEKKSKTNISPKNEKQGTGLILIDYHRQDESNAIAIRWCRLDHIYVIAKNFF